MEPIIQTSSLEIQYSRETKIIYPSIHIHEGETILLTGATGSGKTTLLYLIYGAIPRVINAEIKGKIEVMGKNPGKTHPEWIIKNIAYIPQEPWDGIITHTVETELKIPDIVNKKGNTRGINIDDIFPEILGFKEKTTYTLSSGETQKLNIVTRIKTTPKILLMDEPLAYLDPPSRKQIKRIIKRLQKENYTIIISEHNKEEWNEINYREIKIDREKTGLLRIDYEKLVRAVERNMPKEKPELQLKNISYKYPMEKTFAVKNISIHHKGSGMILLKGPNGSGKTTLLKIIAGLIRPIGEKIVKGAPILIPDNPLLYYSYPTVFEEIGEERFNELAKAFNLEPLKNRGLKELSTGERRIIAIASALTKNKNIILLDEPSAGIDKKNLNELKKMLEHIKNTSRLIIIATHDNVFDDIADITIYLEKG